MITLEITDSRGNVTYPTFGRVDATEMQCLCEWFEIEEVLMDLQERNNFKFKRVR